MQQRDWLRRGNGRVLTFTAKGEKAFNSTFSCTPA
jgi:hypothetical protein